MIDPLTMTDEAAREVERVMAMFEPFDNPLIKYRPHGEAEVVALFGDPSRGGKYTRREKPDPVWKKKWIVDCHPSNPKYPPVLPQLAHRYWAVHRLFEPTAREVCRRIEVVAPGYITRDGGTWCHVFRHMRDNPKMATSMHAWCAIDIEPERNGGKPFKPGKTPPMWSAAWKKAWPDGITPPILAVMKSCGLRCGAEWVGYVDPMHGELQGGRVQV